MNPELRKLVINAHAKANRAQIKGTLKVHPCEICGAGKAQKHHPDYTKPLLVQWLCHRHHKLTHYGKNPAEFFGFLSGKAKYMIKYEKLYNT